jgi:hypothetical protein
MNWITIAGIITIGIGTLLTYYGTSLSSSKDKIEITNKIDSFKQNLEKVKAENISDSEKVKAVDKIQNEFQSWATNFVETKEDKKLLLDKNDVNLREKKSILNTKWRNYYVKAFESINQMIEAYNKASGQKTLKLIESNSLPSNIYDAELNKFKIVVQFTENLFWNISLTIKEPIDKDELPWVGITLVKKPDTNLLGLNNLLFSFDIQRKSIIVLTSKPFDKANFKSEYPLDDKTNQLAELLKKAFEYQILITE